jgi:hypothetical protein
VIVVVESAIPSHLVLIIMMTLEMLMILMEMTIFDVVHHHTMITATIRVA